MSHQLPVRVHACESGAECVWSKEFVYIANVEIKLPFTRQLLPYKYLNQITFRARQYCIFGPI